MIKFHNVYIKYINDFYSLFNFSCEIHSHTLFIGDFYSGTTAIMRTLSGIDKFYSGDILINNKNIKEIKNKDLNIAYLPQNPILFKNNIYNNLYFPLKIRKISKNTAKTLIYSIFKDFYNNNYNIFNNYLNIKNNNKNLNSEELINLQIKNILKLKINKLNLSEQKIITLIRAMLWQPNYMLLEDFYKDLNNQYTDIANYLLNKIKTTTTIIACEEQFKDFFKDFKIIDLTIDKQKKED